MTKLTLALLMLAALILSYPRLGQHGPILHDSSSSQHDNVFHLDHPATGIAARQLLIPRDQFGGKIVEKHADPRASETSQWTQGYAKLPLAFAANRGQTDPRVKFVGRGIGYTLFLARDEAVMELQNPVDQVRVVDSEHSRTEQSEHKLPRHPIAPPTTLRMKLVGASPSTIMRGLDELSGKVSYFIGNDPQKWAANVPLYAKVKYHGVYPGIDLLYYGNQRQLEYDFEVAPRATPSRIRLSFQGSEKLRINRQGDLIVSAKSGEIRFRKPVAYQPGIEANGNLQAHSSRVAVASRYVLAAKQEVAFEVAPYDVTKPLVIDPTLVYSTYLGGSGNENSVTVPPSFLSAIAVDSLGNVYVTGNTTSTDFPTVNPFQAHLNGSGTINAFVSKLSPDGSTLIYSTYLGGTSTTNYPTGIAVDSSGSAYITGLTNSTDFPLRNAFQGTFAGVEDAFVTKLSADGTALVYSTFLSGSVNGFGYAIAVDSAGSAYVAGSTQSADFPTVNAFQTAIGGPAIENAFVSKFKPDGSALLYSTYLGGSSSGEIDRAFGIAVDSSGGAYVTGFASASTFPTKNAAQPTPGGSVDGFVSKFDTTQSGAASLLFSTFLGGSGSDTPTALALDSNFNAYVTGDTNSADFPTTPGSFQATCAAGCQAGFVTKYTMNGALVYSTYMGAGATAGIHGIGVDASGNAYVAGTANPANFPSKNPLSGIPANANLFVAALNPSGSDLVYSTPFGGSNNNFIGGMAVDGTGNAYITGGTSSVDFPVTAGALQKTIAGGSDAFVALISSAPAVTLNPTSLAFGTQAVGTTSTGQSVTLTNSGNADLVVTAIAASGDFAEMNSCGTLPATLAVSANCSINVTFTPTATGARSGNITITDNAGTGSQLLPLSGTGTGTPTAVPSVSSLSFNNQNLGTTSAIQNVQVQNTGTSALTITGVASSDATDFQVVAPGSGASPSCVASNSVSVPQSASCFFGVQFSPHSLGPVTTTILITDNAANSPQQVSASGTGTGASTAVVSPASLTFPGQIVGVTSASQPVTLSNTGNLPLAISSISHSGDFAESDNCGASVAVNASCTLNITFTPTANGARVGSVTIADNAAGSPQSVGLTGTGLDFSVSSQTGSQTVSGGQPATYTIAATAAGGAFNSAVAFTAAGAPSGSTVTFQPASVTPAAISATTTMTVTPPVSAALVPVVFQFPGYPFVRFTGIAITTFLLSLGLLRLTGRERCRVRTGLLLAATLGLAGCSSGPSAGDNAPPPRTFTITVTGTSGALQRSTTVTLTVK